VDVQLYQRQELPPTRVGAVKPEHIPELGVGEVIAGFAGTVFDKIWATRAANEESEYVGSIETALGEFETAVADSPGMSPENLKKLKDATLAKIDDFSKLATLPKSKQYIKDFTLKNRGRIGARLNTSVEEIITEQELGRAKINLDMLVAARDSAGVTKLFFGTETKPQGLSGTLIDPETATLMHAAAQDKINVLQSKFDAGEAQADAFDIWQDTITEENPEGDLTKAFEFINADPRIPESDKQEAESELRMRIVNRRAEAERINEEKWEKNETELWKSWREGTLTYSQIESGDISKRDRDIYTGLLDAEREAGKKSLEAETKIIEAKDKNEVMRFLGEGIEKGEINKSFIYITAKAYDFTEAEQSRFIESYKKTKLQIETASYEDRAGLISLITAVQFGKANPDDVKDKITELLQKTISSGMPKDEAVALAVKYREKLATAITAWTKEDDPIGRPRAQLYFSKLDQLYKDGDIETLEYDKMNDKLTQEMKKEPTAEQAAKFWTEMTKDAVGKGFFRKLWDWNVRWRPSEIYKRKFGPEEEESPYPEYPDAFKLGDSWFVWRDDKRYRIQE